MSQKADQIYKLLVEKATLKQKVFDNTLQAFRWFKEVSKELETEFNQKLKLHDHRVMLRYRNLSLFQAELKVAGDLLLFYMHSNVFQFDRDHRIWKLAYLRKDYYASYVGIISIYNFLADSFKYNRTEDMGYLIARVFVNKDNNFFVEGKKQTAYLSSEFENRKMTKQAVRDIIEAAIFYALQFDLLVPPYENVKIVTVNDILEARKIGAPTGKRVGFNYSTDDVDLETGKIIYSGG